MKFKKYLKEALTLSQAREFKYAIIAKKYKTYLNKIFKNKDRLYIPFESKVSSVKPIPSIKKYVEAQGYEIIDYGKGLAKRKDSDKKNLIKIGKILKNEPELLKQFSTDKNRTAAKKKSMMIVISRHPYDIAGMSTGRGWTSCMRLGDGQFRSYVHTDVKNGTLVAYVIDAKDKNINKPISRLLLKQFVNVDDYKKTILYPDKIYGSDVSGFKERIIKWLKTFQDFKGTYTINPKLYADDVPDFIGQGDKNHKDDDIRELYYKNNPKDKDAKKDKSTSIKLNYYENNPKDKDSKKDENSIIRSQYYEDYPEDKDAKKDDEWRIREAWYENHPEDEDAKKDEDGDIRMVYYFNHSDDEDAKKDEDSKIRKMYYRSHPKEME